MAERKAPAKKAAAPKRTATPSAKKAAAKRTTARPRRTPLRAVGPDEKPKPPAKKSTKPKTITEAAAAGDARELLVAMQTRIARAIDNPNCPPRDLAALTRRLHEITRDIEAIDAAAEEDGDVSEPVGDEAWDEEAL